MTGRGNEADLVTRAKIFFRQDLQDQRRRHYRLVLPDIGEQQVKEQPIAASWNEEIDRLRGWIVAG